MVEDPNDHPGVLIFPPLLLGLCLVAGAALHFALPFRLHLPLAIRVAGGALALAAIALARWGERTMKASGTNVRPDRPALTVVRSGPFARSRNPLYLALFLLLAGIGVAAASPGILAMSVPLLIVLRLGVIAREERYLEAKFGEEYLAYKRAVRRWL